MSWRIVATVAAKDLRILIIKRSVRMSIVLFPLIVAVGFPLIIRYAGHGHGGGIPVAVLPRVLDAFTFVFVTGGAVLPSTIASYSLVGEKLERSLEPLLATPVTDGEVLLGKSVAAFVPPIVALWAGAVVFMALTDQFTRSKLGYLFFPNGPAVLTVALLTPLAAIMCVEFSVLISARVSDVRAAQQLAALAVLPFGAIYVMTEIGLFTLDGTSVGVISGIVAAVDVVLFFASRATFRREEILTRWA